MPPTKPYILSDAPRFPGTHPLLFIGTQSFGFFSSLLIYILSLPPVGLHLHSLIQLLSNYTWC